MSQLKELRGQLATARDELAVIFQQADAGRDSEGRQVYDLMRASALTGADEGARVDEVKAKNDQIADLAAKVREAESAQNEIAGIAGNIEGMGEIVRPAIHGNSGRAAEAEGKSLGQLFVESPAFKGYQRGSQGVGPMAELDVDLMATLFETGAGWAPESVRSGRIEYMPLRPAPKVILRFPEIPTAQAAYKYMEETTHTQAAAERAEGAAYAEAAFVLTEKSQTVRSIGVKIPVTDEQLEDEEGARAFLDNRLSYQLARRLDDQALAGNGVAPNLLGTENVVGIQTQALGADPIFDAAAKLFRKIQDDGFADPDVFFIAPSKWETVKLTRTADGIYILGNPSSDIPVRLWGVPGVETVSVTSTKLVAGAYGAYSLLAIRRGVDIQVGYDSGDFVQGKVTIRAGVRVALVHLRPKAFGTVTGL